MSTAEDPSSSCEGPSTDHPISFSHKKKKKQKETCIIQGDNQS